MSGWEDVTETFIYTTPKFTLFWGRTAQNWGSNLVKTCPSPDKSHCKRYIWSLGQMSC